MVLAGWAAVGACVASLVGETTAADDGLIDDMCVAVSVVGVWAALYLWGSGNGVVAKLGVWVVIGDSTAPTDVDG